MDAGNNGVLPVSENDKFVTSVYRKDTLSSVCTDSTNFFCLNVSVDYYTSFFNTVLDFSKFHINIKM